jgi:TetR/AcrR family transcriptional repressor of nem operon
LIVARAAALFNVQGFTGASLADVMAATGLEKGGIYNHFGSKDELALASFDYAASIIRYRFEPAWESGGVAALDAFVAIFRGYAEHPPLPGGCPILNTAVESDDTHPALRQRARDLVDALRRRLGAAVEAGIARGEIRPETDADDLASLILATLEGGLMLTKLEGDPAHLHRAADHLTDYIDRGVRAQPV